MDIFKFAMKMELDGKAFYEKQAAATADPDLKEILLTLAEEEERHFRFFHELSEDPSFVPAGDAFSAPGTINRVQNIFEELSHNHEKKTFGRDVVSVWMEALHIEEQAVAFYREKAQTEPDPARKSLLLQIAAEESNHVQMIDGVLMYLKHPDTFAESAQFRNFQSLEGR
jgi:rubrerythrin